MLISSKIYSGIVLNIPHSSTELPKEYLIRDCPDKLIHKCKKEATDLIDYYTDELFAPEYIANELNPIIIPLIFPYCRIICDVERLPDDPLELQGKGIIYKTGKMGKCLQSILPKENRDFLLQLYLNYQQKIADQLSIFNRQNCFDNLLLIDCHSFSSTSNNLLNDAVRYKEIDICLGYNEDASKPDAFVISFVTQYFNNLGYKVKHNLPFSNSKTVPTQIKYHSLMIELNKHLYMDEVTLEKNINFSKLQRDIQGLYPLLLKDEVSRKTWTINSVV